MTVRLPAINPHRRAEVMEALRHEGPVRRNVEASTALEAVERQRLPILRFVIRRVEPDPDLDLCVIDLDSIGPVVDVERHLPVGGCGAAGPFRNDLADLA